MIERLQFVNKELWWVAVCIAILFCLLFVWKEWKGNLDARLVTNSLIAFLGIIALFFLYLKPSFLTEVSEKAVLLTDNYSVSQLDSIKTKEKFIQTIQYRPGLDFSKSLDSINEVIILGNGLPSFDFWQLEKVSTIFIKGAVPKGVVKLKYEPRLRMGNDLNVSGLYNKPVPENRLVLETGSGDGLDSIVLAGDNEQGFELSSKLKATGKFVYQLTEKDSTGVVLNSNPLPLEILEKEQLRIFISNGFPSFETKYLKNFLAEIGHQVVVRSQITKGRYKFEYFNSVSSPLYGFREADLKDFDLLVLDAETYLNLSKTNKDVLMGLMKNKGTGLFVQPNETLFRSNNAFLGFEVESNSKQKNLKVGNSMVETYPFQFANKGLYGILVENHSYAMVVGKGKWGTTLLNNTYQLVLEGKSDAYRTIWTSIISNTAKARETSGTFETLKPFSFDRAPITFALRTNILKPTVTADGDYTIPLRKNTLLEDAWEGKIYPKNQGWHALRMQSDTSVSLPYFVMDTIHWKSIQGVNKISNNSRFFGEDHAKVIKKTSLVEISAWWFFLIFMSCMGYLWLVPKLKA